MRRLLVLLTAGALILAACSSVEGADEESLPLNSDAEKQTEREAVDSDEPIPVEPNGGIGNGATGEELPVVSPDLSGEVEAALADLRSRLGDNRLIEIVVAHELTWPNGALGCPEPDVLYTEALIDGYRIELSDGTNTYGYHGAAGERPFFCENPR
ncbi:MAG: hypothetical protein ACR2N2_02045 [Acidimicrobiia bacterium]